MSRPTHQTSNYGWALWHLEQMEAPSPGPEIGLLHAAAAQARATLALVCEMGAARGADPTGPTVWSDPTNAERTDR